MPRPLNTAYPYILTAWLKITLTIVYDIVKRVYVTLKLVSRAQPNAMFFTNMMKQATLPIHISDVQ